MNTPETLKPKFHTSICRPHIHTQDDKEVEVALVFFFTATILAVATTATFSSSTSTSAFVFFYLLLTDSCGIYQAKPSPPTPASLSPPQTNSPPTNQSSVYWTSESMKNQTNGDSICEVEGLEINMSLNASGYALENYQSNECKREKHQTGMELEPEDVAVLREEEAPPLKSEIKVGSEMHIVALVKLN
ncbi:hypothetical protein L2E82_02597 [Cichorium intybus]|uniref:Uncharacterized protein n=1 Tax=Cichorium intybus TaxID=13427 RepID=A0ACB9H2W9_CICIN|nr:hypothetical protein L2E82_02597 [Cichorium intybus]